MPRCVVLVGPPCAGKSMLGRRLADALGWPLLAKDAYKELAFETLGWSDRAWSARVSRLAWALLFAEARRWLQAGAHCVLEGNFRAEHHAGLHALAAEARAPVEWLEVRCTAPAGVLRARFAERAARRHPGHVDADVLRAGVAPEVLAEFAAPPPVLALGGPVLHYDTAVRFAPEPVVEAVARWARTAPAAAHEGERCVT